MKIIADITNLLDRSPEAADGADIIVLGTCDQDYVPLMKRAYAQHRQMVLFTFKQGGSKRLKSQAQEVRYLDACFTSVSNGKILGNNQNNRTPQQPAIPPPVAAKNGKPQVPPMWQNPYAEIVMKLAAHTKAGKAGWMDSEDFDQEYSSEDIQAKERAVQAGLLLQYGRQELAKGGVSVQRQALKPNLRKQQVKEAWTLGKVLPNCIRTAAGQANDLWVTPKAIARVLAVNGTFTKAGHEIDEAWLEGWLRLAEKAGIVASRVQPGKDGGEVITHWRVAHDDSADEIGAAVPDPQHPTPRSQAPMRPRLPHTPRERQLGQNEPSGSGQIPGDISTFNAGL